jgi:hypothetical protein
MHDHPRFIGRLLSVKTFIPGLNFWPATSLKPLKSKPVEIIFKNSVRTSKKKQHFTGTFEVEARLNNI